MRLCVYVLHIYIYAWKKITYACLRSSRPCQSSVDYGNTKITQHALKVSEDTIWKNQKMLACVHALL